MQPEYDDDRPDTYDDMPLVISVVLVSIVICVGLAVFGSVR